MYKTSKLSLYILLISLSFQTLAADLKGITKIFKNSFWSSHYEEGYCGKNIENLVTKAIEARLDLDGAEIVQITDEGGWMFGMVNALAAREGGRLITPASASPARSPGEKNWYFHVVLLVDGKVLDYDFTNQVKILPLKDYLNAMFIPVSKMSDLEYKKSKMKSYKITTYPAEDYILRREQRLPVSEIEVESYLRDYLPDFFKM